MNMDMDEFVSNATAELEMVEAQLQDIEARAEALRVRREGLRFTVKYGQEMRSARRGATAAAAGKPSSPVAPLAPGAEVAQTDRVLQAMEQIGRAAMTPEIRDKVNTMGGSMDIPQVRSALGYLMRKRPPRVERVRPGVWRLPKEAASPVAFTPAPLAVVSANGRGES